MTHIHRWLVARIEKTNSKWGLKNSCKSLKESCYNKFRCLPLAATVQSKIESCIKRQFGDLALPTLINDI